MIQNAYHMSSYVPRLSKTLIFNRKKCCFSSLLAFPPKLRDPKHGSRKQSHPLILLSGWDKKPNLQRTSANFLARCTPVCRCMFCSVWFCSVLAPFTLAHASAKGAFTQHSVLQRKQKVKHCEITGSEQLHVIFYDTSACSGPME